MFQNFGDLMPRNKTIRQKHLTVHKEYKIAHQLSIPLWNEYNLQTANNAVHPTQQPDESFSSTYLQTQLSPCNSRLQTRS